MVIASPDIENTKHEDFVMEITYYLLLLFPMGVSALGMLFYSMEHKITGIFFILAGVVVLMAIGKIIFSAGVAAGALL